jgi:hypothetical protein
MNKIVMRNENTQNQINRRIAVIEEQRANGSSRVRFDKVDIFLRLVEIVIEDSCSFMTIRPTL